MVSWKWLAAVLLGLVLTAGGQLFTKTDQLSVATAEKLVRVDVDLQQEKVRNDIHYKEIQRQLTELQHSIDRLTAKVDSLSIRRF